MERSDPCLYYGTNKKYLGVQFSSSHGVVVTTTLGKPCHRKRLGMTKVNVPIQDSLKGFKMVIFACPKRWEDELLAKGLD